AVQDGLKKGGVNVVFFDGITAGEKDFSTLVARLKKENIDFVYFSIDIEVAPSWRPDKVFKIELDGFVDYLRKLEAAADVSITRFD
ncbi:glucuronate isomerase, partial [Salmonella enterica subsp. enterica serovar Muenster]|nr:glucuronate isomerase [Salmonella enterica subsp. enterica serovar Muenster]